MLMKRKAFEHLGGYDEENFSPYGGDETDWNLKAWQAGYKVLETKNSIVVHVGSHDTKRQNPNQYLLLNEHRIRAILFSAPLYWLLRMIPGLAWIFFTSLSEGKTTTLVKAYINNIKNWRLILKERAKRQALFKKFKEGQKRQGEEWF
jgi:GT2 family glycosyltransferase